MPNALPIDTDGVVAKKHSRVRSHRRMVDIHWGVFWWLGRERRLCDPTHRKVRDEWGTRVPTPVPSRLGKSSIHRLLVGLKMPDQSGDFVRTTPWIGCDPKCVAAGPPKTMVMFE